MFVDSGVTAAGSVNSVITGHNYRRCMTVHKSLVESLMENFIKQFDAHRERHCSLYSTFDLWNSYCEIVELLLTVIRATRTGDWDLHLTTAAEMTLWFFSYDHTNYARYMSIYLHEMPQIFSPSHLRLPL